MVMVVMSVVYGDAACIGGSDGGCVREDEGKIVW